jgi:hypothetical protein
MSSHSAVTLIPHNKRTVSLFEADNSKVLCRATGKGYAIEKLSSALIRYKEDEQILSILRNIVIDRMPVFFTEGSTDPDILKEAWEKLYSEPIPFIPIYAFCCDYLRRVLQDERVINEMRGRPLFGLFDFDEAYNEWNSLKQKDSWELFEGDPYKGMGIVHANNRVYAFILPVPSIPEVEAQVVKDKPSKAHYAHASQMGIEHLFFGVETRQYFEERATPGGGSIVYFNGDKTKFAKEVVPGLSASFFEVFRPMFDFIKSKCPAAVDV